MMEFLYDQIWQFVGVILGLIALIVTVLIYYRTRKLKDLSYEILSEEPLLSEKEEFREDLKILYKENIIKQAHLILIRIINSGNIPILSSDYERFVNISFGDNTVVLTSDVSERNSDSIIASTILENNKVYLNPVMLNSGDYVTVKALVSGYDGSISIDGRIVGVKEIQVKKESKMSLILKLMLIAGLCLLLGSNIPTRSLPEMLFGVLFQSYLGFSCG